MAYPENGTPASGERPLVCSMRMTLFFERTRLAHYACSVCLFLAAAIAPYTRAYGQPGFGPPPGGPMRGPMGGVQADRALVKQFDADKNGRLDYAERQAARVFLAGEAERAVTSGRMGPGFPGAGGRGGPPGMRPTAMGPQRATASPGAPETIGAAPLVAASTGVYDLGALRTIYLTFEHADWEQELEAFYHTDVEVPAEVTIDGKRFANVGVHFRGNSSYMMVPRGSKRSLNLSLDFIDKTQQFGGYRSLNLLNANGDATFVRSSLYSTIANAYLPAPRANFVRVVINGEVWGVYQNVQQFNRDFLRDFYHADGGARWKVPGSPFARGGLEYLGDSLAPYQRHFEIKTKNDTVSWRALIEFTRILNTTPTSDLPRVLPKYLAVDEVLRFLAVDITLANSDGYWTRASDYNLWRDSTGRFHVLPHDMNEAFMEEGGPGGPGGPRGGPAGGGATLDPLIGLTDTTKPLRSRLLAVPAWREQYLRYVRDIATTWLDWNRVGPLVAQWQALIAKDVTADTKKLSSTEAFTTGVSGPNGLRHFIEARRVFLLDATAR